MGEFKSQDACFNIGVNVKIVKRHKITGRVLETREAHNRCLKLTLMGLAKFLNGEYNETQPQVTYYDWIPRYLGVGTNLGAYDSGSGVTSTVSINDTKLLDEISPRIKLPDRHTIVNKSTQSYVQLIISTYLPESYYNGQTLREAGLFSKSTGNNCLFRVTFDDIKKTQDSIVEVNWTISIISVDSQNEPYEETNKDDLFNAIKQLILRYGELCPKFVEANVDLINAITEYGRSDSSEASIQANTETIINWIAKMSTWENVGISEETVSKIDNINGEVIE